VQLQLLVSVHVTTWDCVSVL